MKKDEYTNRFVRMIRYSSTHCALQVDPGHHFYPLKVTSAIHVHVLLQDTVNTAVAIMIKPLLV